jgi:hypothetical protein
MEQITFDVTPFPDEAVTFETKGRTITVKGHSKIGVLRLRITTKNRIHALWIVPHDEESLLVGI